MTPTAVPLPAEAPSTAVLEWAQRLVRLSTISHQSNLALIECIADHLRGQGVDLRLTYDEDRRKANLFATLGAGKPGGVVLSGHTDTVPWDGQAWTVDPLGATVRDGRLYGRGSADMKGFIGCCVALADRILQADLPHAVHLALSYDEEVGGFGVRHLVADLREAGLQPTLCLVGEPTDMVPALSHKGVYRMRCCVKGKPAHSSLTPQAVNAVEAAARIISRIADMGDRWRAEGPFVEGFDVPWTTAAVCRVDGGIADNVVPEDCRFHYEFRNLPGTEAEDFQRELEQWTERLLPAMHEVDPATGIRFEKFAEMPAFLAQPDEPAARLAAVLAGTQATTRVAFGTEAGLFQRAGMSTVICGPGSIGQAHQPDEFVSLAQLAQCEAFIARLAEGAAVGLVNGR
jgi:acetylornithine deacetylase